MVATNIVYLVVIIVSTVNLPCCVNAICQTLNTTDVSVDRIFNKYGEPGVGNTTILNTTGVDGLLKDLALDKFRLVCEEDDKECRKEHMFLLKGRKDPLQRRRKRRSAASDAHDAAVKELRKSCARLQSDIDSMFGISPTTGMKKADFINVCPFLIDKVVSKTCVHHHKRYKPFEEPDHPPSTAEKWGYGFLAITICSLLSLIVIAMIPCLQKSFYEKMMAYLVAMAVGTLCGDALLHLIPHAFIDGANAAAAIEVSEEQAEKQHYSQVYRALIVLAGIYLFFVVEQFMKIKANWSKRDSHSHGDTEMKDAASKGQVIENVHAQEEGAHTDVHVQEEGADKNVEEGGHGHGGDGHGHSHGNKNITGETKIAHLAWMVIVGDGFHNFSDGLAVGAAFSAGLSTGLSTTIAIFCHELPHELGDFAVLIKAGMTAKQAIVYNLVGAVLSYVGLVIGILAGTSELGRHVILCLTAGLFLYVSLVNMMGEVTGNEGAYYQWSIVICQHLGMLSGIAIMLVISLFEHDI